MTNVWDDNGSEDFDKAFPTPPKHETLSSAAKTKFEAWHHPRKQYVRTRQWCTEVQKLLKTLRLGSGDPFRYLTLPGNELLDVRDLHGVCEKAGVKLRYLGFNSVGGKPQEQAELALSQAEVRALSAIDDSSLVIEDRLETLANERSLAYSRTTQAGPFHAINLDLCDSITLREVGHAKGSALGAIGRLLELQLKSTSPWLLFITTKAQPSLMGQSAKAGFQTALSANAKDSDEFRKWLAEVVETGLDELQVGLEEGWKKQDLKFLRLFCVGLGKWLLGMLTKASPPRPLSLLSACYYRSGPDGADMLSLALLCGPGVQQISDPANILPPPPPLSGSIEEVAYAIKLTQDLSKLFDLDEFMANNAEDREKLIGQASRLMKSARFDDAVYEAWARAKFDGDLNAA